MSERLRSHNGTRNPCLLWPLFGHRDLSSDAVNRPGCSGWNLRGWALYVSAMQQGLLPPTLERYTGFQRHPTGAAEAGSVAAAAEICCSRKLGRKAAAETGTGRAGVSEYGSRGCSVLDGRCQRRPGREGTQHPVAVFQIKSLRGR